MDKGALRRIVEDRIFNLGGGEFQDFCDRLCLKLFTGDYTSVRAAGPKGDMKCDGYCPKERVFFAMHATRNEKISRTKSKIKDDLVGCIAKHQNVKKWIYMTNYTLCGEVETFVDEELRPQYSRVEIETWDHKRITEEVLRLEENMISEVTELPMEIFRAVAWEAEIEYAADLLRGEKTRQALSFLQRLWDGHSNEMSPWEKYRTKANIGHAYERLGKYEKAAESWLEAKQYVPSHEKARAREALAYLCLGRKKKANELARELLKDFPEQKLAQSIWIRSSPREIRFQQLEEMVPEHQRSDAEVAMALAERAATEGLYNRAEEYIRHVIKEAEENPNISEALGDLMIARANIHEQLTYERGHSEEEKECLKRACKLFTDSLRGWEVIELSHNIIRVRLKRANVYLALGDREKCGGDIEFAYQLDPNDKSAVYQCAIANFEKGDRDRGIELLRTLVGTETRPCVEHLLCRNLYERNEKGDREETLEILRSRIGDLEHEEADFRTEYLALCLEIERKVNSKESAFAFLDSIGEGLISSEAKLVLHAEVLRQEGDTVGAVKIAKEILDRITRSTSREDKRRIAFLLQSLGMHKEALNIWKDIVTPEYLGRDTMWMLKCAERCEDAKFIISFSEKLRENGLWDRDIFELELYYREKYNDNKGAKRAIMEVLDEAREEAYIPTLRVRLSLVGMRTGERELIETDASKLPSMRDVDPHLGMAVVAILREGEEPLNAVKYAYEMLRRNWDNDEAHIAMMGVLSPIGKPVELDKPEIVDDGVAVYYQEDDTGVKRWHIIEDCEDPQPDKDRNEFFPHHPRSIQLMGKKVGENFVLSEHPIQERYGTVLNILSKYVYRWNVCLSEFDDRFPGRNVVHKVISKKVDGEFDIEPMKRLADQRAKRGGEVEKVYTDQKIPLFLVGAAMGVSLLEAMQHITSTPEMRLHCCWVTDENLKVAGTAIRKADSLVLDGSALITLLFTQMYEDVAKFHIKCRVSEGAVKCLQGANFMRMDPNTQSGVLTKDGDGYTFIESSPEQAHEARAAIKKFIDFIERTFIIDSDLIVSELDPERRERLVGLFGKDGVESMMMGAQDGCVLWTDDLATAEIGKCSFGCKRVWTQFIFEYFAGAGNIEEERAINMTLKLLGMGYYFTRLNMGVISKALEETGGDVDKSPLCEAMEQFSDEQSKLEGIFRLACGVIKHVWQVGAVGILPEAITIRILEKLSKRAQGYDAINALLRVTDNIFGVDVVNASKVKNVIRGWLASGHIIRP